MKAQYWLQIDLALLTILGTAVLGSGQQSAALTILMLVAAPAAVVCTDIFQWFRLSRTLANLAAIGSVAYAVFQFFSSGVDNQLLSVANLLVYLQLILLFQEKNHRLNWQLLVLSLLEVVVSAAMSLNFRFFILLLVYLFCALLAMALLFMLREASRYTVLGGDRKKLLSRIPNLGRVASERLDPTLRWLLGAAPQSVTGVSPVSLVNDLTRSGYMKQVGVFGVVTLAFATVLFYSTPRLGGANWQGGRSRGQPTVGFSRQVSLDEMGEILQNDELALRISFFNHLTNEPVRIVNEPYLRGGVLTRYSDAQGVGRWTSARSTRSVPLAESANLNGLVRQEVWLEPTNDATVFGAFPLVKIPGVACPLGYDRAAGTVSRFDPAADRVVGRDLSLSPPPPGRFRYTVGSFAFRDGWQTAVTPFEPYSARGGPNVAYQELADCLHFRQYDFPRIKQLAQTILEEADAIDADAVRKARVLEQHFLQPGRYQYSLRFRQARNRELDPIEDFVANHRTGHCEYFATALILMLRSQQIPARLVVGYHGGEYNSLGNYYLVRQRDAHAWVEVLLDPEQVQLLGKSSLPVADTSQGGWLRLDPTPGSGDDDSEESQGVVWNRFDDFMEYAEFLWSDYVTGLNRERQIQTIYAPIWERVATSMGAFFDPDQWRAWSAATLSKELQRWGIVNELGGFGWRMIVGVTVMVVMAILVARPIVAIASKVLRWLLRLLSLIGGWLAKLFPHSRRGRIEFYERLERLFARQGLRRADHQTPREFLQAVETASPVAVHRELWGSAAWQVVEAFYRVRFGGVSLDKAEILSIEGALRRVATGLEGGPIAAET